VNYLVMFTLLRHLYSAVAQILTYSVNLALGLNQASKIYVGFGLVPGSRRPVARFYALGEQNKFLGGKIFRFIICLKKIFLGATFGRQEKNLRALSPNVPRGLHGPGLTFQHEAHLKLWIVKKACSFVSRRILTYSRLYVF